jgi:ribonuclease J
MYVTVHRGTQQIGGNLIEISTENTRLLFDVGANLPPLDGPKVEDSFELEGLTYGEPAFDWVFLSHHHNDHCGLLGKLLPGIPVFSGDETKRILNIIADFTNQPRPDISFKFQDRRAIQLADIQVTPIGVEHSAKDAYMFLIQADGKNVLYTGDFRASEKALSTVRGLLGEDGKLDLMITEGTNIRPGKEKRTGEFQGEELVKRQAAGRMRLYKGTVFVLCSSANEDRIRAISMAAVWVGRVVCEDLFQSVVRNCMDENTQRFVASGIKEGSRAWPYFNELYRQRALVGAETLAKLPEKKVVFVRTSMLPFIARYMDTRPPEEEQSSLLLYSMWQGYKQTAAVKRVLDFCGERGITVEDLHTSGHASREMVKALIDGLNPAVLLPIHCEAADRREFLSLHKNCLMLNDGQRWKM